MVDEVVVDIGVAAGDMLVVGYAIIGELDRLRIPARGASLDPERLWAHTCCEMFVAPALGEGYVEWNFSPSGQIARLAFSAYRKRIASAPTMVAGPAVTMDGRALRLEARVPLPPDVGETARLSLTAVLEDATGALSYWALRHPCDRPDFHHPEGFALGLTLGPPIAIVDR
jgi:hypothetical protein